PPPEFIELPVPPVIPPSKPPRPPPPSKPPRPVLIAPNRSKSSEPLVLPVVEPVVLPIPVSPCCMELWKALPLKPPPVPPEKVRPVALSGPAPKLIAPEPTHRSASTVLLPQVRTRPPYLGPSNNLNN